MKIFIGLLFILFSQQVSFHSLSVQDSENSTISFENFVGKKVLIANIATNSPDSNQLQKLEELQQLYSNNLVVIAVPSNDFGNEPRSGNELKQFLQSHYNIHYLVTENMVVKDSAQISSLYQWLTKKTENGMTDASVSADFYKFLINENGQLVGIYSDKISPTDGVIRDAIK